MYQYKRINRENRKSKCTITKRQTPNNRQYTNNDLILNLRNSAANNLPHCYNVENAAHNVKYMYSRYNIKCFILTL